MLHTYLQKYKYPAFAILGCTIVYVLLILHYYVPELRGDEARYISFAQNLLNGFYSPPAPDFNLWSGPGYPLALAPFVALGFGHLQLVLLNVLFLILALVFAYRAFSLFVNQRKALVLLLFLGLYFPISKHIYFVHTECFTWSIVSALAYVMSMRMHRADYSFLLDLVIAILLASLVMVKVIFGYVVLVTLGLLLILLAYTKRRRGVIKGVAILSFTFILCLPWLAYTYSLTGRAMFWTNSSSLSLYTMSTSYDGEYGDWQSPNLLVESPHHKDFITQARTKDVLGQYDAYRQKALENIKNNKLGYARNWVFNITRMLFELPNHKRARIGYSWLKSTIPILVLLPVLYMCFVLHLKKRKVVRGEISVSLIVVLVYLFGSSLVSSMERMFFITLPFWMVYIAYFWGRFTTSSIHLWLIKRIKKGQLSIY